MQLKVLLFFQLTIGNQALQIKRCRLIHCVVVRLCWLIALFLVHLEQILMGLEFLILGTIEGETHDADDPYKISVKRDQMFSFNSSILWQHLNTSEIVSLLYLFLYSVFLYEFSRKFLYQ